MEEKNHSSSPVNSNEELIIIRELNAPRELVWKAWTEPERLTQWFGPKGFTMKTCKVELRPGGVFHYYMISPTGNEMWGKYVYREVIAPEKLIYVVSFSDEEGNITRHPLSPTWPLELLNTLKLTESGKKTILELRGIPINATEEEMETFRNVIKSVEQGFAATFLQLVEYLNTLKQ